MLAKSILGVFYIYNDNYVYTRVVSVDYYYYWKKAEVLIKHDYLLKPGTVDNKGNLISFAIGSLGNIVDTNRISTKAIKSLIDAFNL